MISGVGIDMVDVERIREKLLRNNGFREYVFSIGEMAYCEQQANPAVHYAGRFAAKEALLKAMGTGLASAIPLPDAEICHDAGGKPYFNFSEKSLGIIFNGKEGRVQLSIAHEKDKAIAIVIIEQHAA